VEDYLCLIDAVVTRVTEQVVSAAKRALNAGQTVAFGPFAVSQEAIQYKGKTLPWNRIAALEIQLIQGSRRLRIRKSGSLLPWCWADLDSFPNGVLFHNVLRLVCPPQFLS
jgi:hypothetical protein